MRGCEGQEERRHSSQSQPPTPGRRTLRGVCGQQAQLGGALVVAAGALLLVAAAAGAAKAARLVVAGVELQVEARAALAAAALLLVRRHGVHGDGGEVERVAGALAQPEHAPAGVEEGRRWRR